MKYEFTVEEILQAAEQGKYPNNNSSFILKDEQTGKTVAACVIGEAFLNLGMVPNGVNPLDLNNALRYVYPDGGSVSIKNAEYYHGVQRFSNLSDFINELNGIKGYQGKKRIPQLVRKYFSKSLNQKVTVTSDNRHEYRDDSEDGIQYRGVLYR